MFCAKLNEYMNFLQCSGKEFSQISGISEATISRYKSGERTPKPHSADMEKLCQGIYAAAKIKHIETISYPSLLNELNDLAKGTAFNYDSMQKKFNMLCSVLSVNAAEMSKSLTYDSSYISRIRSGKRKPANPQKFASDVAKYITKYYDSDSSIKIVAELIHTTYEHIKTPEKYIDKLTTWLMDNEPTENAENPIQTFLEKLNDFDLNEHIKAIHFDELKVPTLPFQFPTAKNYYGVEEMKNGELDFLKATALSKSKQNVFMGSDMQMDDMAADMDFAKKYMFGLAVMLKKGLHLNVVHNLNRPFHEIMLGLECWIPLYMTGQISPFYLKGVHNQIYCHFLNVSGAAALTGESIAGYHAKGKYYLTKNKEELAYYRERAANILKKAHPLMEIYREDNASGLHAFLLADSQTSGNRKNIWSTLPIYTATEKFLINFLDRQNVSGQEKQHILRYAANRKQLTLKISENNCITDEIPYLTKQEFEANPLSLSLSVMFGHKNYLYSYEEYLEHLTLTKEFAKNTKNYSVMQTRKNAFSNINIMIHEKEHVMISKSNTPPIHFIVRHPILQKAIENLEFPIL